MFSINYNSNIITEFNNDNCIYSSNESRPSKSLINCEKYKQYSKLNLNLDILNEFSYLNSQSKTLDSLLLKELINIFKLYKYENYENISMSFDSIIINEISNFNLVFCFENNLTIQNIINNLYHLIKELSNGDCLIINYINLYTYPAAELLILILNLFSKIKVYYCKILKQNIIYCINYKNQSNITVFIRNIIKKYKSNIRQFGIYINPDILNIIKNHNSFIFDYYNTLNNNITDSTLEDKEFLFKHYCKKYSKINSKNTSNAFECNHNIKEFNLFNCHICNKCYELFSIH